MQEKIKDDTISRQAAIDAIIQILHDDIAAPGGHLDPYYIFKALKDLPPAVVTCKECKYQDKGENESESWNLCGYRPWLYVPVTDNHYCGYAERKDGDADG